MPAKAPAYPDEVECLATGLEEQDARLLVYAAQMIEVLRSAASRLDHLGGDGFIRSDRHQDNENDEFERSQNNDVAHLAMTTLELVEVKT